MKRLLILQNNILHYRKPLYNELAKNYMVTVLHSGSKSVGKDDRYEEIITPVKRVGPFFLQSHVIRTIRTSGYDVVVAMFDIRWIANTLAAFLSKNTRFLYWGHRYSKNRLGNWIRNILMRMVDGVILYSDSEIPRMLSGGVAKSKIFVAANTMLIPNYADSSSSYKDSFLFTGRAQRRKRVDILIRAFSEVLSRIPDNITLNIVGSGSENDRLKCITKELGVSSRVIFHGKIVDHEQLQPLFDRALAYVSPGPVGLSVLHSFAYGVPVVTHFPERHGPEFDNISDRENSLIYKTYDELKEIIVSLCNDKAISARLGRNAYELYAQQRTLEKMVKGFRDAIENAREKN